MHKPDHIEGDDWHNAMIDAGWHSERDMYGVIVAYWHYRGAVIEKRDFDEWRQVGKTPPPF